MAKAMTAVGGHRARGNGPVDVLDCSAAKGKARCMRDGPEQVYALADEIRGRCLRDLDSLLTPGESVWSSAAAEELVVHFVDAPDTGGGLSWRSWAANSRRGARRRSG